MAPLYVALSSFHSSVAKYLIERGADVNKALVNGITAMHIMALIGDVEKVSEMISKGEDVNGCDEDGKSVLYYGAGGGSLEIVSLLVSHGADVNKVATGEWDKGKTPLVL